MIIKIYSDSLAFPRPNCGIYYRDTYPSLLSNEYQNVSVLSRGRSGATIDDIYRTMLSDWKFTEKEEYCILHFGIVDCAPRPIPRFARYILSRFPEYIREKIVKFIHNNRKKIINTIYTQYTSSKKFEKILNKIIEFQREISTNVIIIGISETNLEVANHSPGINEEIKKYNKIIMGCAKKFDINYVEGVKPEDLIEDGIHLSINGHKEISEKIKNLIKIKEC